MRARRWRGIAEEIPEGGPPPVPQARAVGWGAQVDFVAHAIEALDADYGTGGNKRFRAVISMREPMTKGCSLVKRAPCEEIFSVSAMRSEGPDFQARRRTVVC